MHRVEGCLSLPLMLPTRWCDHSARRLLEILRLELCRQAGVSVSYASHLSRRRRLEIVVRVGRQWIVLRPAAPQQKLSLVGSADGSYEAERLQADVPSVVSVCPAVGLRTGSLRWVAGPI